MVRTFAIAIMLVAVSFAADKAENIRGKVVAVVDGDAIKVQNITVEIIVRLVN